MTTKAYCCPYISCPESSNLGDCCPAYSAAGCTDLPRSGASGILVLSTAPLTWELSAQKQSASYQGWEASNAHHQELLTAMAATGLTPEDVAHAYVQRCGIAQGGKMSLRGARVCWGAWREDLLAQSAPKVIVVCGAEALKVVLGTQAPAFTASYGSVLTPEASLGLPPVLPAYSPAFVLRNPAVYRQELAQSFAIALQVAQGGSLDAGRRKIRVTTISAQGGGVSATIAALDELARLPEGSFVSYDCETNGLNPWDRKREPRLLTVSVSKADDEAVVVPVAHASAESLYASEQEFAAVMEALRRALTAPQTIKVGHNVKFDNKWLHRCLGWRPAVQDLVGGLPGAFDTMLAHGLLEPDVAHGLDALVRRFALTEYGAYWIQTQEAAKVGETSRRKDQGQRKSQGDARAEKEARYDYGLVPLEDLIEYNAHDTAATYFLARLLLRKLLATGNLFAVFRDTLMPASAVYERMEEAGIALDAERIREFVAEYRCRQVQAQARLCSNRVVERFAQTVPNGVGEVNWASPKQKAELFYTSDAGFQCTPLVTTKTGNPSTSREALEALVSSGNCAPELVECVQDSLAVGEASKILGTYLCSIPRLIGSDGKIHAVFHLHTARSGRTSSSDPNLQNQPKEIRPIYCSRWREAGAIIQADYSQLEARVAACFSKEEGLLKVFREGRDFHIMNAALMLGKDPGRAIKEGPDRDWGEVTPEDRQKAKGAVSFGLMYGRSARALADDLGIPLCEAEDMARRYFDELPKFTTWMAEIHAWVRQHGYVDSATGRRRWLPEVRSTDRVKQQEALRQAVNTPIQGTASDMTVNALVRLWKRLQQEGLKATPVATVHDSIVVDSPLVEAERVIELMYRVLTDVSMYPWAVIPFDVEFDVARRWEEH